MNFGFSKVSFVVFALILIFNLTAARYDGEDANLKLNPDVLAEKKSTNLGSRYNKMRKKSDRWTLLNDLKQRRLDFYLANLIGDKGFFDSFMADADNDYRFYK